MTPFDLPGPRSAATLERLRAVLYPGIGEHLAPFVQTDASNTGGLYRATLVPWLWFLSLTSNCRIYQQKSVPDIVLAATAPPLPAHELLVFLFQVTLLLLTAFALLCFMIRARVQRHLDLHRRALRDRDRMRPAVDSGGS